MSLSRTILSAAVLLVPSMALADETTSDSGLSDAETSYTGAVMLEGDLDVSFGDTDAGRYGLDGQNRYAFFSGNTLYAGAEDEDGNAIDAIVEFFWFESSVDRGADFYVAVVKARMSPSVSNDWYLMTDDAPVLSVLAETDLTRENGGFRWDWSVPFENYGMDSYGEVTMTNAYGIGGSAEGSAMYAKKVDESGATADVDVQTKGYLNSEYKVQTQYQVTLYRWEMDVRGSPGTMQWDFTLNNSDRDDQNAYHEYFLVMQVDEGETFTIDNLDVGGELNGWWWGQSTQLGVALQDIELSAPAYVPDDGDDGDDTGDTGWGGWDDTGTWDTGTAGDDDTTGGDDGMGLGELTDGDVPAQGGNSVTIFGCSTASAGSMLGGLAWLALGLVALRRRQD